MDIVRLRSFVMVARLGHLTRAAERLCLTQPAVTAHIKAIEQELGLALFDRAPGRISLTRHGELLLPEAEHVLATVEAFAGKARQIKGEVSGNLLIATVDDSDFLRLGELLYALRGALPLLQLKTRQMLADDILDGLLNEEIDAGFHIGSADHPDIGVLPLRTLVYQAVGPRSLSDRLAGASWKDIAQLPWIAAPERSHVARFTRTLFAQHGVRLNEAIECDQLSATLDLVRSGLGLSLLREDLALAAVEKGEVALWPHGRIEARLNFLYRLRSEADPSIIGLLSVLRQHWAV
ncbi:LysR family transcriptional regulator [Propionivibrio dicarboxylicus]|uniref:DNA-binding transcriptional regulator, LysR family n=1 Tax=Propionivibrio dicarboxylicus TaxID=83767 RepID=A0A1G7Y6I4_9RHOO|nr:LysR family transcriptional regulator [Propionivibrio dicarboxylicus]SDG92034.1 DNA-binding transcriptional regulator, LysR family [Propionivibrio dicarboxylicus]